MSDDTLDEAVRRAAELLTPDDIALVGRISDELRGEAAPDLGPRSRVFVRFDVPGTMGAAVWLDDLRKALDPVGLVRHRAKLLMALQVPLTRAMEDVGPSIFNEKIPVDHRDRFYAFMERRIEEATERHDPGSGRTSSPTREALAVYRVVVSLVANEHRINVSLEPR